MFPGPAIISALHSAATTTLTSIIHTVSTEISTGTPSQSVDGSEAEDGDKDDENNNEEYEKPELADRPLNSLTHKGSVKTTTTIFQTYEPSPPQPISFPRSLSATEWASPGDRELAIQDLGSPPHARGLLLLAEMSSEGHLMTPDYTSACVAAARADPNFVLGFISQHCLNSSAQDLFLTFTPGVSLPPEGVEDTDESERAKGKTGDGLGQRWRSPREVILKDGADVIIVGRGILNAKQRWKEAERYQHAAWKAYEERIGRRNGGL